MDMFEMEEFIQLGDVWAQPDQTFDASHFDDLEVTEAKDGLHGFSFKPKPPADVQTDLLHDLLEAPVGGYLGLEWMEQSNLMQYLPLTDDAPVISESITELLEDDLSFTTPSLAGDDEKPTQAASVEFLQNLIQQQEEMMDLPQVKVEMPPSPAPSSPEAQVAPEIDFSATETVSLEDVLNSSKVEFIEAPLSPDDVESLLSSAASPSTIDTSSLYSDDGHVICNTSDLYEVVSTDGQKSRGSPYSRPRGTPKSTKSKGRRQTASISSNPSELELELMSKKDRKKLQNKNAAIRYRQKKKTESEVKREEEDELESINQSLKEKVEELTREIGYMKNLISDVRKARGLPPLIS